MKQTSLTSVVNSLRTGVVAMGVFLFAGLANAAVLSYGGNNLGLPIPDGSPVGISQTFTVNDPAFAIVNNNVRVPPIQTTFHIRAFCRKSAIQQVWKPALRPSPGRFDRTLAAGRTRTSSSFAVECLPNRALDSRVFPQYLPPMRAESIEFLKSLVNTPSPSGNELRGQRVWLDYATKFADETYWDAYGNCVAVLNKGGSPRLMLAAHADEIAMTVNFINKEGFIHVRKVGGVDPAIMRGQRVSIHTRDGDVRGVIGNVAPHLTRQDPGERKAPKMEDLFIDIGVRSRSEAERVVHVGDPITLVDQFEILRGDVAVARAFDNRIGTFAVAETLRLLKESGTKPKAEILAVSNIMEEGGLLGARQIAYSIKPDVALVVDVTHATDYPCVNQCAHGDIKMGHGPTVTHGGCNHVEVIARIEAVAKQQKIKLQHEAMSNSSGTDTDVIFWTRGGIPSGLISLPNRYMHSPVEVVNLKDLEQIPQLMAAFALSLKKGEQFKVKI